MSSALVAAPSGADINKVMETSTNKFPTLITHHRDPFEEHIRALYEIATIGDRLNNWHIGTKRSRLDKVALFRQMFELPVGQPFDKIENHAVLLQTLTTYSLLNKPRDIGQHMSHFERILRCTPCSKRIPESVRLENMFERCGVTLLLYSHMFSVLNVTDKNGTLRTAHFPSTSFYRGGIRIDRQTEMATPSTKLATMIEDLVRKHIAEPCTLELVRLLCGVWPYFSTTFGPTMAFDTIMNHIGLFIRNGSLMARITRSRPVILGSMGKGLLAKEHDQDMRMSNFQRLGQFGDGTSLFIVGYCESARMWNAHGNSERYGKLAKKIGEGTYATVARYETSPNDPLGNSSFAVKFQCIDIMREGTSTDQGLMGHLFDRISSTYVAKILTENVCPYDGYVDDNGAVHAASIPRLIDHQLVGGALSTMAPGLTVASKDENVVYPYQIEVFEFINGRTTNARENVAPWIPFDHAWYTSMTAQVLGTLRSFKHLQFTHADLSLHNIMATKPTGELLSYTKVLHYPSADGQSDLYIDLSHTSGYIIKVIDFSLSTASTEKYGNPGQRSGDMICLSKYHPALDLHMFGCWLMYDFVACLERPRSVGFSSVMNRYCLSGGITSATLGMLRSMLLPDECIITEADEHWLDADIEWSSWNSRSGKLSTHKQPRMTIVRTLIGYMKSLRQHMADLEKRLATFETTGELSWPANIVDICYTIRELALNSARSVLYCSTNPPSSLSAIDNFLSSQYFVQYRTVIREGVVVMNQKVG